MTKRSDIPKEIKIPPRKPKAPPKKPKLYEAPEVEPWRDVPFDEWLDTIQPQTPKKRRKKKKKSGGKIMAGYKAGGKV